MDRLKTLQEVTIRQAREHASDTSDSHDDDEDQTDTDDEVHSLSCPTKADGSKTNDPSSD